MNDCKPYLFQSRLGTCQLTALLNFIVELKGRSPLKYESSNFMKIIMNCHNSRDEGGEYITPALKHLKLRLINLTDKTHNSLRLLKRQMIIALEAGEMIQFAFHHPHEMIHFVLVTDYYRAYDSFRVINAQLLTNETVIEYLSFRELTKMCCVKDGTGEKAYFNSEEKTNRNAEFTIKNTKIICSTDLKLKNIKREPQNDFILVDTWEGDGFVAKVMKGRAQENW
jgi:hypothetical protein